MREFQSVDCKDMSHIRKIALKTFTDYIDCAVDQMNLTCLMKEVEDSFTAQTAIECLYVRCVGDVLEDQARSL